jgi:hypothetical protein
VVGERSGKAADVGRAARVDDVEILRQVRLSNLVSESLELDQIAEALSRGSPEILPEKSAI